MSRSNHRRQTTNKNGNDLQGIDLELLQNPFGKRKNISVMEDKERGLVLLKIYGTIEEPEEYVEELEKLEQISKDFDVLEITLNSPGGSLNTTVEIASLIKNFRHVITIGKGEIASAAFMLWTMGNIRIVTDYSMYMAHRESYGMYGKTIEHRDAAVAFGRVYEEMFEHCFGDLLNDTEKAIAERSEAWVSYKELLERDRVISYEEYNDPINPYGMTDLYVIDSGKMFLFDGTTNTYRSVKLEFTNEFLSNMHEFLYGMTQVQELPPKPKEKDEKKKIESVLVKTRKKKKKNTQKKKRPTSKQ